MAIRTRGPDSERSEVSPPTVLNDGPSGPHSEGLRAPHGPRDHSIAYPPIRIGRDAFRFVLVTAGATALALLLLLPLVEGARVAVNELNRRVLHAAVSPLEIPALPQRSTIYAADGSVLGRVYKKYNRAVVPLHRVNAVTRKAVLAIEDARFYEHGPIDLESIARALLANIRAGNIVQGGSTIAQQLVKNTVTGSALTIQRKIREAVDAIRLERAYTKDQILGMYLNDVYLGHGVYGIGTAAEYYFAEPVEDLTLSQAALLAGMIASPARFDPIDHPKAAFRRRNVVLGRMQQLGWIGASANYRAATRQVRLSDQERDAASTGPRSYWEQFVVSQFLQDPAFGATYKERVRALFEGGLRIYTTLDPRLERLAENTLKLRMSGPGLPQSALVSIVPQTGAITTMAVGNWPWEQHRYNLATDPGGGRTAGSAFKGFTLAAALENGISPNTVYNGSSPRTIPDCGGGETWTVNNAEPGSGSYPLWLATADSVNVVFAQVIDQVGPKTVAHVAHRMGITSPLTPVCPLTLGTSPVSPLEMTSGYSTIANGGVRCTPYAISKVLTSKGELVKRTKPVCTRAMPADVAAEETYLLEGVVRYGTGTAAYIGRPQAGKTGTGQDYVDAWFMGYVPQLATGVWVGYAKAEIPMPAVPGYGTGFGGVLAAPIWHDYMLAAVARWPVLTFPPPPSLPLLRLVAPSPSPSGHSPAPKPAPSESPPPSPSPEPSVVPSASPSP